MSDLVVEKSKLLTDWQEVVGNKEAVEAGAGAVPHDGPLYYPCKHIFGRRLLWGVEKNMDLTGSYCASLLKNKSDINIICKFHFLRFRSSF